MIVRMIFLALCFLLRQNTSPASGKAIIAASRVKINSCIMMPISIIINNLIQRWLSPNPSVKVQIKFKNSCDYYENICDVHIGVPKQCRQLISFLKVEDVWKAVLGVPKCGVRLCCMITSEILLFCIGNSTDKCQANRIQSP